MQELSKITNIRKETMFSLFISTLCLLIGLTGTLTATITDMTALTWDSKQYIYFLTDYHHTTEYRDENILQCQKMRRVLDRAEEGEGLHILIEQGATEIWALGGNNICILADLLPMSLEKNLKKSHFEDIDIRRCIKLTAGMLGNFHETALEQWEWLKERITWHKRVPLYLKYYDCTVNSLSWKHVFDTFDHMKEIVMNLKQSFSNPQFDSIFKSKMEEATFYVEELKNTLKILRDEHDIDIEQPLLDMIFSLKAHEHNFREKLGPEEVNGRKLSSPLAYQTLVRRMSTPLLDLYIFFKVKELQNKGVSKIVVAAGGYHTDSVSAMLKESTDAKPQEFNFGLKHTAEPLALEVFDNILFDKPIVPVKQQSSSPYCTLL